MKVLVVSFSYIVLFNTLKDCFYLKSTFPHIFSFGMQIEVCRHKYYSISWKLVVQCSSISKKKRFFLDKKLFENKS